MYSNEKVLAVYYEIYISGQKLSFEKKMCIQSISITETEDGADTATFNIVDANFEFIEDNIFIEDVPIKIEGGWHDEMYRFEFNGYISTIDIDFPEEGCPTLEIYCMDNTHLMNRKKKKRTWSNVSSADVVKLIGAEYGFTVVVESGYKFKKESSIAQSKQTDIEFIQSLAEKESDLFICKLKGETLYYIKKGLLTTPVAELWYKENTREIISFKPQINKETKQEKNEVATITSSTKKEDTGIASNEDTNREVQGEPMQTSSSVTKYTFDVEKGKSLTIGDNWEEWSINMQEQINASFEQQYEKPTNINAEK